MSVTFTGFKFLNERLYGIDLSLDLLLGHLLFVNLALKLFVLGLGACQAGVSLSSLLPALTLPNLVLAGKLRPHLRDPGGQGGVVRSGGALQSLLLWLHNKWSCEDASSRY